MNDARRPNDMLTLGSKQKGFTLLETVIAGPEASYAGLSRGFDQLMAGAKVLPATPASDANRFYPY